jgi:hypothetical protein
MQKSVMALAAILALGAGPAFATKISGTYLTGTYSVSPQYSQSQGGAGIGHDLNQNFSVPLTIGTQTAFMPFITAYPDGSCQSPACAPAYNKYHRVIGGTVSTDSLSLDFTHLTLTGGISFNDLSASDIGNYSATYNGAELSCAVGDGNSNSASGNSDCVTWGGTTTWNAAPTMLTSLGSGYNLEIFLQNATDWNITPKIAFEVVPGTPPGVPEPGTLSIFAAGLAALGFGMSRRRRAG